MLSNEVALNAVGSIGALASESAQTGPDGSIMLTSETLQRMTIRKLQMLHQKYVGPTTFVPQKPRVRRTALRKTVTLPRSMLLQNLEQTLQRMTARQLQMLHQKYVSPTAFVPQKPRVQGTALRKSVTLPRSVLLQNLEHCFCAGQTAELDVNMRIEQKDQVRLPLQKAKSV